jgi:hypothetical protein
MLPRFIAGSIACLFFVLNAFALSYTVKPDSGIILVWQKQKGGWMAIKDSSVVKVGDSLYLDDQYHAKLFLSKGCVLYLRGELRATFGGSDSAIILYLDQGQVFLKRDSGVGSANIKIFLRTCAFMPIGTVAAMKYTKQGEPTTAVLAGKIRIESPKGDSLTVLPGNFGSYDPVASVFKEGKLPSAAIASLESWAGVKLDQAFLAIAAPDTEKQAAKDTSQKAPLPPVQSAEQQPARQKQ